MGPVVQLLSLIMTWNWRCKAGLTQFIRHECTSTAGCGHSTEISTSMLQIAL